MPKGIQKVTNKISYKIQNKFESYSSLKEAFVFWDGIKEIEYHQNDKICPFDRQVVRELNQLELDTSVLFRKIKLFRRQVKLIEVLTK